VHPLTFIAISDDFSPLRWRQLGRVYRSNVGRVLALSESYIRCDEERAIAISGVRFTVSSIIFG